MDVDVDMDTQIAIEVHDFLILNTTLFFHRYKNTAIFNYSQNCQLHQCIVCNFQKPILKIIDSSIESTSQPFKRNILFEELSFSKLYYQFFRSLVNEYVMRTHAFISRVTHLFSFQVNLFLIT